MGFGAEKVKWKTKHQRTGNKNCLKQHAYVFICFKFNGFLICFKASEATTKQAKSKATAENEPFFVFCVLPSRKCVYFVIFRYLGNCANVFELKYALTLIKNYN